MKPAVAYSVGAIAAVCGMLLAFWPAASTAGCPYLPSSSWIARLWGRAANDEGAEYDSSGLRIYTRQELAQYDGTDPNAPLLLGMAGDVFDVKEKGSQFYAKGSGYNMFAGKDSTRALSLGSMEEKDLYSADISDFTEAQLRAVKEQHDFYLGKYTLVGRIKADSLPPTPPPKPATPPAEEGAEPGA